MQIIFDANLPELVLISDNTGQFYCRKQHTEKCIDLLVKEDIECVSVCSNGVSNGKYIFNPEIEPYYWDDNGEIIFPYTEN